MGWLDFFRSSNGPRAGFVKEYETLCDKKIPSMRPLDQLVFVVLDTETTGVNPRKDYILSFGALKVKGYKMRLDTSLELYLEAPILNKEAIKVHELMYSYEASSLRDFAKEVLDYIGSEVIVGHHIGFDIAMLEKAIRPFGLKNILNPVLDTMVLAMRLEKGPHYDPRMGKPGEYALDNLCERYGIPLDDRHTAAGDAFLTAQLLLRLLKLAEQKGIKDFGGLMR